MFNSILDNTFFDMLCEDFNEELDSYEDSLVENAFLAWDVDLNYLHKRSEEHTSELQSLS